MSEPRISAVIPTYNRPQLVPRAVRSALAQTLADIEVIVVLDGPDDRTIQALREIPDERLRITVLPHKSGVSSARNAGIQASSGPWVAFLDDDDEWLPRKLELQLATAERSVHRYPIVSCRVLAQALSTTAHTSAQFVWPRRVPQLGEHVSEYLFCRRSGFFGEGLLQTSTLLVSASLARQVPFDSRLNRMEDVDWVLRASVVDGAGIEFAPLAEPLAVWHRSARLGAGPQFGWRDALEWAQRQRSLMTPRAYAALLLTWLAPGAVRAGAREAFWPMLRDAFRNGTPTAMDVATYLGYWIIPRRLQGTAATFAARVRRPRSRDQSEGD